MNRGTNANSVTGFGFLHDGTFQDIFTFLSQPVFQNFISNSVIKSNLQAFLLCFDTGTAPAVGYTRVLAATNVNTTSVSNDWFILESQAAAGTNIDLIAKGTIDGQRRGLLYVPGSNNYKPDTTNLGSFTHGQLVAKVLAGDRLMLLGVPPGSGHRMGIDRDPDGVLDGDVPRPSLQIVMAGDKAVLNWPLSAAGYFLEASENLFPAGWSRVADAVEIAGSQNVVTNTPSGNSKFFRLRLE